MTATPEGSPACEGRRGVAGPAAVEAGSAYAGEPTEPLALDDSLLSDPDALAARIGVRFDDRGLVPAVVQQRGTGEVLMVAWMNAESLALTLRTRTSWFWSRSRRELWNKGATSGNVQRVERVLYDCDADTVLLVVDSPGPACHTGHRSCFFREVDLGGAHGRRD
jgi:phosphoribosyl-AMP cyclohydrolase